MAQYIDKNLVFEVVKGVLNLLIEEDKVKSLLPKIGNDALEIYEGFMSNLSDLYKYVNNEYKDKIVKVVLDNLSLDKLEVKDVDFWHKQSEEDIDDSIIGWSMHSFICLMKDGTTQKFTGIQDESYDGSISKYLDCVDDNYEWEYDDITYWIEVPNIRVKKGE